MPSYPWGAVSPIGNLFEAILLLAGYLDSGITDTLPPVLFNIPNKTMQVTTEALVKLSLETLALAEREFRAARSGPKWPKT
jgi:hypothetical protein